MSSSEEVRLKKIIREVREGTRAVNHPVAIAVHVRWDLSLRATLSRDKILVSPTKWTRVLLDEMFLLTTSATITVTSSDNKEKLPLCFRSTLTSPGTFW